MFVWSMKTTRTRLAVGVGILGLLLAVILLCNGRHTAAVSDGGDDAKRLAYLQEQGYEVAPQWTQVREWTVPADETIPSVYRGKRIKCFSYATAEGATVNLYEYNGNILGAHLIEE